MSDTLTTEAERTALDDLVNGEGWAILRRMVDQHFGAEANLREIDAVMEKLAPGDDERAVVTQIRAASKAAYAVLALPESRLQRLEQMAKPKATDMFKALRRV